MQGVKQVFESTQTFQLKDKTAVLEYFSKPCPEQQDALSPQGKREALLEISCPLISLISHLYSLL